MVPNGERGKLLSVFIRTQIPEMKCQFLRGALLRKTQGISEARKVRKKLAKWENAYEKSESRTGHEENMFYT